MDASGGGDAYQLLATLDGKTIAMLGDDFLIA